MIACTICFILGGICLNYAFYVAWLGSFPEVENVDSYKNRFYLFMIIGAILWLIPILIYWYSKKNKKPRRN